MNLSEPCWSCSSSCDARQCGHILYALTSMIPSNLLCQTLHTICGSTLFQTPLIPSSYKPLCEGPLVPLLYNGAHSSDMSRLRCLELRTTLIRPLMPTVCCSAPVSPCSRMGCLHERITKVVSRRQIHGYAMDLQSSTMLLACRLSGYLHGVSARASSTGGRYASSQPQAFAHQGSLPRGTSKACT